MTPEPDARRERWRPVVGFEGRYEVSDLGAVHSIRAGRAMRCFVRDSKKGYVSVALSLEGRVRTAFVHTLVLEAFIGPRPTGHQAAHLDGDRANNALTNLAWKTQSENEADKLRHGTALIGERANGSRLTADVIREIRAARANGESRPSVAERFGLHKNYVSLVCSRRYWRHV